VRDNNESDRATSTPVEGVRILGAKETPAVRDGERDRDRGDDPRDDERDSIDLSLIAQEEMRNRSSFTHRVPVPIVASAADDDNEREVSVGTNGPVTGPDTGPIGPSPDSSSGEMPPLPHWTEPPTGAVPAIFSDDTGEQPIDDLDAWAPITGSSPRFRAEGSDWAEADFGDDLSGEHERLGALSEAEPVDEEAEFAEALAQRRRRLPRAPRARSAVPEVPPIATPARRPRPVRRPAPPEPETTNGGAGTSRDVPTAIMTAATIVIVALVCFTLKQTATTLLASVIIGIASIEFSAALRTKGFRSATLLALVASATLPFALKHYGVGAYPIYFALVVVVSMLWFLWEVTPGRPLLGVATTVLGFAYVGGLGGFAGLMLARRDGVGMIIGVAICTIAYDVFGFFVGSQFGRTPIAPRVSPHKSLQGTLAGMGASVLLGWVVVGQIAPWDRHYAGLILGLLVAIGAFLGDLCESMIKRDLGLKDFGTLLPGHGGVLDRFDGLLFCLPIAYYITVSLKLV
jgi:phosphatidate cytidylyltransferase